MKKILSLFALLMTIVIGAKAGDTGTDVIDQTGASAGTAIIKTGASLLGAYDAGQGGGNITGYSPNNKGVKLRTQQTKVTVSGTEYGYAIIEANAGYKLTSFKLEGTSNGSNTIALKGVYTDIDTENLAKSLEDATNLISEDVTYPNKNTNYVSSPNIAINAEANIIILFPNSGDNQMRAIFTIGWEQTAVIVQEITGVTLNGTAISSDDLATLKSTKALTINGSSLNGIGMLGVTLSSGATTVTRTISDGKAVYTFSINGGADAYTVTVTNVAKTYTAEGAVVYYSENGTKAEGADTKTVTANGITAEMVADKTFQYGSGNVTFGSDVYVPLKLSTGSAVNVTFPSGKVATKVVVYGWSANGNGAINSIKETSESTGDKSKDTSADIFYATNTSSDVYPSVYEYTLDNWESFYFNPGGSASQPFVVFDFVLEDATPAGPIDATFSLSKTALKVGETAKVLVNGSDIYGANFNVPTSLWESEAGGPYISLSADGTVTAVKATPANYCFYFFANSKDTEKYVSKQTTTMYIDITEATPVADVYEVTSNNQEFILSQANVTDEANAFVTTSTGDWQTSDQTYGDYPKARYYNMSKTARYMTFKVKGATNFKLNVQNGTAGRTYTVKVGDGEAQTITHGGDALEYSDVFETGSTGEVTITVTGGGSSVYPVSIIFNTTDGSKTFTIGPNGYSTYCGDEKFTVEGATVNTASVNATTGVVTLKAVSIAKKAIEAGVGIVLTGEEGAMITIKPTRNAAASISGNDLVGVNAETTSIDANAYVLSSNDTKTSFIKAGAYGNVTDLMNKAYIVYTGMQEGSLDIQFEGEATAINNVNANDNADSAAPVKVIKNGKLFIGNYNVAGQLVK